MAWARIRGVTFPVPQEGVEVQHSSRKRGEKCATGAARRSGSAAGNEKYTCRPWKKTCCIPLEWRYISYSGAESFHLIMV
jgi:hypothetical protein